MAATQQQVEKFIKEQVGNEPWFPQPAASRFPSAYESLPLDLRPNQFQPPVDLPDVAVLGQQLYEAAAAQSLDLADFLATPNGKLFADAAQAVLPPPYGDVFELVRDALLYAANLQHEGKRKQGGLVGVVSILIGAFLAWLFRRGR